MSKDDESDRAAARTVGATVQRLLDIMAALRDPTSGCPWDLQQTFATIAPYTIEEAYEVADAIERGDRDDLRDELGDLMLQVVYHARLAEEEGSFAFTDVVAAISDKMVRRHPHVFGEARAAAPGQWDAIKAAERRIKAGRAGGTAAGGLFEDVAAGLPALIRSGKLQKRAAKLGFDWPAVAPIFDKVQEELAELRAEVREGPAGKPTQRQQEEFGDVLFALVNLGLRLGIDAESALRAANSKFERRMGAMAAAAAAAGTSLGEMTLDEMQALWDRAKDAERSR